MKISKLDDIGRETKELALTKTRLSWGAIALNAITVPLTGCVIDVEDKSALRTSQVDDAWLAAVAGLPTISRSGLEFLSAALVHKGWVSIEEALQFVDIEKVQSKESEKIASAKSSLENRGAVMLLARAESELPGTLARVAEGAKDIAVAALGVLNFTKEVAVFSGKSLGVIASWAKSMRS